MSFKQVNSLTLKELHDKNHVEVEMTNTIPKVELERKSSYKYTGTTSIQQLLTTDAVHPHTSVDVFNLSFPLALGQQKQLKEDYKFSHARVQRRNSTVYENVHRPTFSRTLSVQNPSKRDKLRSNSNSSYDCNFII
jgi:hypothetical protein